jgi:hypothetical protein
MVNVIPARSNVRSTVTRANERFRTLSSPLRLLPDFIIIGGQRCGTTSLYKYLVEHPEIAPARRKEVHFFDNNFEHGLHWYSAHFPLRLSRQAQSAFGKPLICGEASPYYLFHPLVPQRIRDTLPNVKLITLLRDPAARAYSHYHLSKRLGLEPLIFEEAIAAEDSRLAGEAERMVANERYYSLSHQHHSYLARGIYVDQIARWHATFPTEQLLILRSEDFYADPGGIIRQVTDFIGVDPIRKQHFDIHNDGKYSTLTTATRDFLYEYFEPHNQRLSEYLGRDFGWRR